MKKSDRKAQLSQILSRRKALALLRAAVTAMFVVGCIPRKSNTAQAPYARKGQRTFKNAQDRIFQNGGGQLLLKLTKTREGYAAIFDIGLQIA